VEIIDELKKLVLDLPAGINEKKGIYSFEVLVAERKAFLSRKRLVYAARFQVNEGHKVVVFPICLKNQGQGYHPGDLTATWASALVSRRNHTTPCPSPKK